MKPDALFSEIHLLVDSLREADLTVEDAARLEDLVSQSPVARRYYVLLRAQQVQLEWYFSEQPAEEPVDEVAEEVPIAPAPGLPWAGASFVELPLPEDAAVASLAETSQPGTSLAANAPAEAPRLAAPASPSPPASQRWFGRALSAVNRPAFWSMLAAGICFFTYFTLISWNMHVKSPLAGGKGRDTAVALISSSAGIRWSSRMDHAPDAGAIQPGEILEMESGRVELTLSQGVTLQIDGRSRWAIEAGNRATLHLGRMVAKVPPQAVGFTVDTPTARVVDLGTEFEVVVNDAGNSSIHVMQGEVLAVQHNGAAPAGPTTDHRLFAGDRAFFTNDKPQAAGIAGNPPVTQETAPKQSTPEAMVRVGSEPIKRHLTDHYEGDVFICMMECRVDGQAEEFQFFSNKLDHWVTPLLFSLDDRGVYTLTGVGTSRQSTGQGLQRAPFEVVAGSDRLTARRTYFGLFDGAVQANDSAGFTIVHINQGTVSYDENPAQVGPWLFGMDLPAVLTQLKLGGRFSLEGHQDDGIADLEGVGAPQPGRSYSAQLFVTSHD